MVYGVFDKKWGEVVMVVIVLCVGMVVKGDEIVEFVWEYKGVV